MLCKVLGCPSPRRANGYCNKHNLRVRKYGDPLGGKRNHAPASVRFWRRVEKGAEDECWLWTGKTEQNGYGRFQVGGKGAPQVGAHRYSYELHFAPPPSDMVVMHKCDVRNCVNPSHLTLGTHLDNMADMIAKGRKRWVVPLGEAAGAARLTEAQVREMRASSESHVAWAKRLGVGKTAVRAARLGKTWTHVEMPDEIKAKRYRPRKPK